MSEVQTNQRLISKRDRFNVAWRSQFLQACWNFERMQNVGFAYTFLPILKKLYPNKEDYKASLQRHLEFYNTHPYVSAPVQGVVLALEEENSRNQNVDNEAIQGVKIGMMGPLAGVGDPIFWATLRPVIGAFAASLALGGSYLGPIVFFVLWNVVRFAFLWYTQELGYRQGAAITEDLSGGVIQKISTAASILGMFVMGVLVPRWTTMNFPAVISEFENSQDSMVDFTAITEAANNNRVTADSIREVINQINSGMNVNPTTTQTLGEVFDSLVPGLMPLVLTFICLFLLRKNVSPIRLILGLFVFGILMYVLNVMG